MNKKILSSILVASCSAWGFGACTKEEEPVETTAQTAPAAEVLAPILVSKTVPFVSETVSDPTGGS